MTRCSSGDTSVHLQRRMPGFGTTFSPPTDSCRIAGCSMALPKRRKRWACPLARRLPSDPHCLAYCGKRSRSWCELIPECKHGLSQLPAHCHVHRRDAVETAAYPHAVLMRKRGGLSSALKCTGAMSNVGQLNSPPPQKNTVVVGNVLPHLAKRAEDRLNLRALETHRHLIQEVNMPTKNKPPAHHLAGLHDVIDRIRRQVLIRRAQE